MTDNTLTAADQKFYEWFHVHGSTQSGISVSFMREIFMAGWMASVEAGSGE